MPRQKLRWRKKCLNTLMKQLVSELAFCLISYLLITHNGVEYRWSHRLPHGISRRHWYVFLWVVTAYCLTIKLPLGRRRCLLHVIHQQAGENLMIFISVAWFFQAVSKGLCNVTLPHIRPVTLWLRPIHHPVYNYSVQLLLRLSR